MVRSRYGLVELPNFLGVAVFTGGRRMFNTVDQINYPGTNN